MTLADLDVLEKAMQSVRPTLVVVDPIQGYLGARVDMHRANETRPLLAGLARLAERYGCAVLLIRHLRKSAADRAVHRGLGSIDFAAAVRSILLVAQDPKSATRRIVAHAKSNLAPAGRSLAFELRDGMFQWAGSSDLRAEDLLAARDEGGEVQPKGAAEDFLEEMLDAGPVRVEELRLQAQAAGLAWRTVERAKRDLGVRARKRGFDGPWEWYFPDIPAAEDRQDRHGGGLRADAEGETPKAAEDRQLPLCGGVGGLGAETHGERVSGSPAGEVGGLRADVEEGEL